MVLVETKDSEEKLPSVTIDNLKASLDATEYLINKGNKNIAYIGLHEDMANAAALRYEGYKLALRKNNIKENKNLVYLGGMKVRDGYEGINKIIEKEKVDAIFCADDEIAMGAINALRDKNIKVPDNIDVMGFNNIYSSNVFYPKLTTVGQPMYDMGSVGMRMLIKIINKEELENDDYVLQHKIVERDSCKK